MDKLLQADISHGDYETYVPMLQEKFADGEQRRSFEKSGGNGI